MHLPAILKQYCGFGGSEEWRIQSAKRGSPGNTGIARRLRALFEKKQVVFRLYQIEPNSTDHDLIIRNFQTVIV